MADLTSPAESGSASDDLVLSFRLELSATTARPSTSSRDPEPDDLRSLREWLRDDSHVGRHTIAGPVDEVPDSERMGVAGNVLQFVADQGLDVAALVVAILAWRDSRAVTSQHNVTIICNGRSSAISDDPQAAERIGRIFADENEDD